MTIAPPDYEISRVSPSRGLNVRALCKRKSPEIAKGLALTAQHFLQNTKEWVLGQRPDPVLESINEGINVFSYPEQRKPYAERFRGLHRLTQREDGSRVRGVLVLFHRVPGAVHSHRRRGVPRG